LIGGISDSQDGFRRRLHRTIHNPPCTRCSDRFGIKRRDVEILGTPSAGGREVLMSETMRSASATAQWHDRLQQPDIAARIAAGCRALP
jgi:ATP-dependent helicase/nuclease subunit B